VESVLVVTDDLAAMTTGDKRLVSHDVGHEVVVDQGPFAGLDLLLEEGA